jgi:hypothetical protein
MSEVASSNIRSMSSTSQMSFALAYSSMTSESIRMKAASNMCSSGTKDGKQHHRMLRLAPGRQAAPRKDRTQGQEWINSSPGIRMHEVCSPGG